MSRARDTQDPSYRGYYARKMDNLDQQADERLVSKLFAGLRLYLNTSAGGNESLRAVVEMHGGRVAVHPSASCTHYVTNRLPDSKKDAKLSNIPKAIKHVVTPEWVHASVAAGAVLGSADFRVRPPHDVDQRSVAAFLAGGAGARGSAAAAAAVRVPDPSAGSASASVASAAPLPPLPPPPPPPPPPQARGHDPPVLFASAAAAAAAAAQQPAPPPPPLKYGYAVIPASARALLDWDPPEGVVEVWRGREWLLLPPLGEHPPPALAAAAAAVRAATTVVNARALALHAAAQQRRPARKRPRPPELAVPEEPAAAAADFEMTFAELRRVVACGPDEQAVQVLVGWAEHAPAALLAPAVSLLRRRASDRPGWADAAAEFESDVAARLRRRGLRLVVAGEAVT